MKLSKNLFLAVRALDVDMWPHQDIAWKKNWVRYLSVECN